MSDPTSLDTTLKSASSPISLRPEDREPPEDLAQLKTRVREDITRMLGKAVPDIAGKMIDLALNAEKEDVRFRAGKWALEEFSDRSKTPQSLPQTNVQIINAIPFERTAYIDNKPAKTVQLENVTVALPVREIKKIGPEPVVGSSKASLRPTQVDERAMAERNPEAAMRDARRPDYVPPPETPMIRTITESPKGGKPVTPINHSMPPKRNY